MATKQAEDEYDEELGEIEKKPKEGKIEYEIDTEEKMLHHQ